MEENKKEEAQEAVAEDIESLRIRRDAASAAVGLVKGVVSTVGFLVFLYVVVTVGKWVFTDGWDYLGRIGCSPKEKVAFVLLGLNAAVLLFASWIRNAKLSRQNSMLIEMVELNKQFVDTCRPVFDNIEEFMKWEAELHKAHKEYLDRMHGNGGNESHAARENENTERKGKAENEQGEGK